VKKPATRRPTAKKPAVVKVLQIDCPIHHLSLRLQEKDGKLIAICNCPILGNKWRGKVVYERSLRPPEEQTNG
jgi:hypothetical protein